MNPSLLLPLCCTAQVKESEVSFINQPLEVPVAVPERGFAKLTTRHGPQGCITVEGAAVKHTQKKTRRETFPGLPGQAAHQERWQSTELCLHILPPRYQRAGGHTGEAVAGEHSVASAVRAREGYTGLLASSLWLVFLRPWPPHTCTCECVSALWAGRFSSFASCAKYWTSGVVEAQPSRPAVINGATEAV